tara:strand:- start:205 stop:570 length:366 start_codon:yes stop_codon:yes gene_type:complete
MFSTFSFSEDTVGFLIEGNFDEGTVLKLQELIRQKFQLYDKINLYLEDSNIEEFHLLAVIKEIKFKVANDRKFNRIAVVSNRKWVKLCGSIENLFSNATIKSFSTEDRLDAIAWIANGRED